MVNKARLADGAQPNFVIEQGESVLWGGGPTRSNWVIFTAIVALFALVDVQLLAYLGILSSMQLIVSDIWIGAIIGLLIILNKLNAGISYYVTNKRVVWSRRFYSWNKTVELPLESVIDVRSISIKGKGYLTFEYPAGKHAFVFRRLKDDPERIKELVSRDKLNKHNSSRG